jgi:vancomycin resistance protein YoaR
VEPDDFSVVLGAFETPYNGWEGRGKNIEKATFVPLRLAPGDEFSFNATVGPRTVAHGFVDAPVIFKGELDKGVGGGVCQVSSTLHAAFLMAGLEITYRVPHSRPSKYLPLGMDATVGFPDDCKGDPRGKCYAPDLRVKNNRGFPVQVVVTTTPPSKKWRPSILRVEVRGRGEIPVPPSYSYGIQKTAEFEKKMKKVPGKPAGYHKQVQKGAAGMIVTSTLKVNGQISKTYRSVYPPTDEIWEVGEDFVEGSTPPWEMPVDAGAPFPDAGLLGDGHVG